MEYRSNYDTSTRRFGSFNASHLYAVEIVHPDGHREIVEIDANNRTSAAHIAQQNVGGLVASVNMIG